LHNLLGYFYSFGIKEAFGVENGFGYSDGVWSQFVTEIETVLLIIRLWGILQQRGFHMNFREAQYNS
jgi:hypothetical protein